eukprot:TRINITY_DN6242_c0_g1_i1.p1 TRINITY_DN6242_c0_g1~~TRINITY_DN6242_c0_g1_i1.p1  ORF type:complete len:391 (+),score=22.75 TRINITY_DN6242_c0_g1_i1:21-1193(+)
MEESLPEFRTVFKRWIILGIFSFLSCTNAMVWNTFSPIATQSIIFFQTTSLGIDFFSLLYMIVYIPFVFLGTYLINKFSLRVGVMIGAWLNTFGTWLRYGAVMMPISPFYQYVVVMIGHGITAIAQTFILQIPPLIANNWFAPNERTLATSIGALWNQMGIAIGFLIAPLIVHTTADIPTLLLAMSVITTVPTILVTVWFQSKPEVCPAPSGMVERHGLRESLIILTKNKSFILMFFAFGMSVGAFYALTTLLQQMGEVYSYTPTETGWLGFLIVVVGIAGAVVAGVVTDKTQKFKEILLIMYGGSFLCLVWFVFSITTKHQFIILAVCCSFLGFFLTALLPPSLESAVEVTYPVNEEVSSGLLMLSAQIFGIIFILGTSFLFHTRLSSP